MGRQPRPVNDYSIPTVTFISTRLAGASWCVTVTHASLTYLEPLGTFVGTDWLLRPWPMNGFRREWCRGGFVGPHQLLGHFFEHSLTFWGCVCIHNHSPFSTVSSSGKGWSVNSMSWSCSAVFTSSSKSLKESSRYDTGSPFRSSRLSVKCS